MEKFELSIRKYFNERYSEKYVKLILNMLEVDDEKRMDFIKLYNYVVEFYFKNFLFVFFLKNCIIFCYQFIFIF